MTTIPEHELRNLPSVDEALRRPAGRRAAERYGRQAATGAVRAALAEARAALHASGGMAADAEAVAAAALGRLEESERPTLRPSTI